MKIPMTTRLKLKADRSILGDFGNDGDGLVEADESLSESRFACAVIEDFNVLRSNGTRTTMNEIFACGGEFSIAGAGSFGSAGVTAGCCGTAWGAAIAGATKEQGWRQLTEAAPNWR